MSDEPQDELSPGAAAQLWEAYRRSGDGAAFDRLCTVFRPRVVRFCRAILRDAHLAEDLAHDMVIRLMVRRPVVESSFLGLVLTIALNLCLNELGRVARRAQPAGSPSPPADLRDPASAATQQEEESALEDCLFRLSAEDRALYVLRNQEDLPYSEIATVLGIDLSASGFTRRLKSITDKLLRCLKKKGIF